MCQSQKLGTKPFQNLENKLEPICEALFRIGLSIELAVNFSVIAFRFFSENKREGKCLPAISLQNDKNKGSKNYSVF